MTHLCDMSNPDHCCVVTLKYTAEWHNNLFFLSWCFLFSVGELERIKKRVENF